MCTPIILLKPNKANTLVLLQALSRQHITTEPILSDILADTIKECQKGPTTQVLPIPENRSEALERDYISKDDTLILLRGR